jgi:hypothetical protein
MTRMTSVLSLDKAHASGGMVFGQKRGQVQTRLEGFLILEEGRSGVHDRRET